MDVVVAGLFRFVLYTFFGLTLETLFAVTGIERALGCPVPRRVPKRYYEGFVSLYMVPLHGLGLLFAFEPAQVAISNWSLSLRFTIYAVSLTLFEVAWGFFLDKTLGFYPWDYYASSRFRIFKRGYSLWTLVPLWGVAGLILEVYSDLLLHLSPHAVTVFLGG